MRTDKGLGNYDPNNQLETLLTNLIGPELSPVVADLKCYVDLLLHDTEDLTDGLLNALKVLGICF